MTTKFEVCTYEGAVQAYGLPADPEELPSMQGRGDFLEWFDVEKMLKNWGEYPRGAVIEVVDGKIVRVVEVLGNVEPEDATLYRSFSWVLRELNALAARLDAKGVADDDGSKRT